MTPELSAELVVLLDSVTTLDYVFAALDLGDGIRKLAGKQYVHAAFVVSSGRTATDENASSYQSKSMGAAGRVSTTSVFSVVVALRRDDVVEQTPDTLMVLLDAIIQRLQGERSATTGNVWYFLNEVAVEEDTGQGGDILYVQNWGMRGVMLGSSVS